jgi:hypothetical protein
MPSNERPLEEEEDIYLQAVLAFLAGSSTARLGSQRVNFKGG